MKPLIRNLALLVGLGAPLIALIGMILTRFHAVDYAVGQGVMGLQVGWWGAIAGVALGGLALALSVSELKRAGPAIALGLVASAATLGAIGLFRARSAGQPPVHDVSTDWSDPVMFSKGLIADREASHAANPVEADPRVPAGAGAPWAGQRVAEVNARTCPGAKPISHGVDADKASAALQKLGVQITGSAPFRVEGVREGLWYAQQDDVAVRIRPGRTDVRATSRSLANDHGGNCRLVTAIVQALSR
ncbi:MAG: DUF1499 domain-containing protein [Proteobacteria bacterium]|nr:DUF1499 domain-containing protein [Pseudomonadota bacterium]